MITLVITDDQIPAWLEQYPELTATWLPHPL
jgi:hypothetical protein